MAKRTLAQSEYADFDAAAFRSRKVLSTHNDHDEIYHIKSADDIVGIESQVQTGYNTLPEKILPPDNDGNDIPKPSFATDASAPIRSTTKQKLANEAITSNQILTFLIAYKLKRTMADIPQTSSIKALVKGRPIIQQVY